MTTTTELDILEQALQYHQTGQFHQAIKLYHKALSEKNSPLVNNNLASAQLALADNQGAFSTLTSALKEFPESAELIMTFSLLQANMGELNKAIELAKSAVKKAPDKAAFYYNLANFNYQAGHLAEAEKGYKQTLMLNSQCVEAHFNLGTLYYTQSLVRQAIASFKQTVSLEPQFLQAFIHLGQIYSEQGKYDDAIKSYQSVLTIDANNFSVIKALGMVFHISTELETAQQHYQKALEISPEDEESIILMANCLRDKNDISGADKFYQKALKINPSNKIAKDNLSKFSKGKIAAWHFDMLADEARNNAFNQALKKHVKKGNLVLDIGTGSGLLAMMAKRAGADQVVACEMVPDLAQVASQVVADNKMSDVISICNKKSTSLKIGDELPRKADVLVAEILDVGLLGEGVLPTFRHAWANLLNAKAVIIPKAATVEACLIQCNRLKRVNPVQNISDFDLSAFNAFRVKEDYIPTCLNEIPHHLLSDTFFVQYFDFTQLPAHASVEEPNKTDLRMSVTQDGELQGIVFWFQLHLDNEITLSTGPQGEMDHWGQAVYFFENPRQVCQGEEIHLEVRQSETLLQFKLRDI